MTTELTPLEQLVLQIIEQEPEITPHLIKTTAQRKGTEITKKQLQETLTQLTQKKLIKTKNQNLAGNQYTCYIKT